MRSGHPSPTAPFRPERTFHARLPPGDQAAFLPARSIELAVRASNAPLPAAPRYRGPRPVRRSLLPLLALVVAAIAAERPGPLLAQAIDVRVVGAGERPLGGALISLLDRRGAVQVRVLADDLGRARLAATAGYYAVRVDAIGYEGRTEPVFELMADQVRRIVVSLAVRALDLGEMMVQSSRPVVCRLSREEGTAVARLWEEARKALLATQLTHAAGGTILELVTFERDLNRRGQILDERRASRIGASAQPFRSADPEDLRREGYVRHRAAESWYFGPDADLLLSEVFLEDHCFRVRLPPGGGDSLVGLAFEPVRGRRLADINGVLWLDRRSAELRYVEFGYTGVDLPTDAGRIGGRVDFTRLPGGAWIVGQWSIRMPRVVRRRLATGVRDSVIGFREAGGTAAPTASGAAERPARRQRAGLVGRVTDAETGLPLAGVEVSVQGGKYADTTDQAGRYRIDAPGEGAHVVTAVDGRLALVGIDSVRAAALLVRGRTDSVDLVVPLFDAAVRALCPSHRNRPDHGLVLGQVVDSSTGLPIEGLPIRARVTDLASVNPGIGGHPGRELETATGWGGWFGLCGLPLEREITIEAGTASPAIARGRIDRSRVWEARLRLP